MSTTFTQLHQYILATKDELRQRLGEADVGQLEFTINISGRTLGTDECRIKYEIGSYREEVRGNSLQVVLDEYLRRKGWVARYDSLELPSPESF